MLLIITMIQLPKIIIAVFHASTSSQKQFDPIKKEYEEKIRLLEKDIQWLKTQCSDVNQEK